MKHLFSLLLVLVGQSAFGGGTVIGNGGEGIYDPIKKIVLLRDIVETGNPAWIGHNQDPEIARMIYSQKFLKNFDLDVRLDLLVRKLTDLQHASAPLGQIIAEGIRLYRWQKSNQPLAFIDDGIVLKLPEGSQRVQIGNRLLKTIRYDDFYFSLLPEEHKIGFVIHEIVFSLLKPKCVIQNQQCRQLSILAQEIVGHAFSNNENQSMAPILRADMGELSISDEVGPEDGGLDWRLLEVSVRSGKVRALNPLAIRKPEALKAYLSSECRLAWERSQHLTPIQLISELHFPSFEVKFTPYNDVNSNLQYGLSVQHTNAQPDILKIGFTKSEDSADQCLNVLTLQMQKALDLLL